MTIYDVELRKHFHAGTPPLTSYDVGDETAEDCKLNQFDINNGDVFNLIVPDAMHDLGNDFLSGVLPRLPQGLAATDFAQICHTEYRRYGEPGEHNGMTAAQTKARAVQLQDNLYEAYRNKSVKARPIL